MNAKHTNVGLIWPSLAFLAASSLNASAAEPVVVTNPEVAAAEATVPADAESPSGKIVGDKSPYFLVTPKVFYFNLTGGPDAAEGPTHFLQQYNYQDSLSGNPSQGVYLDVDLDVTVFDDEHVARLEREGFGANNHRNRFSFEHEKVGAEASYSTFTSASFGSRFVPATTIIENIEANRIERTNVGGSVTMKPSFLGDLASVTVGWEATERKGNQYTTQGAGTHNGGLPLTVPGTNLLIQDRADRLSFAVAAAPKDMFEVAYEASYEKFVNTSGDNLPWPANFEPTSTVNFFYIPNTSLTTHGIRLAKQYGNRAALAGGYSVSWLRQLSDPTDGPATIGSDPKIRTDNAYFTFNVNATERLGVEGHLKRYSRDNDINYSTQYTIDNIDSLEYGLSAMYRPGVLSSTLTAGWKHRDVDRDRLLNDYGLYRNHTVSDEIYLKYKFRPAKGLTLEVAPSYMWADKTAYPTEPADSVNVKLSASYLAASGVLVSGYYTYKHATNDDLTITETSPVADTVNQSIDDIFHTAALTFAYSPRQTVNTYATLFWTQTDAETYYLASRNVGTGFVVPYFDQLSYKVNNLGAVFGVGWQATDVLAVKASYSLSQSWGRPTEGSTQEAGTQHASIDSLIHGITLGGDYQLDDQKTLKAYYLFQYYEDNVHPEFDGGLHNLMLSLAMKF